MSCASRELEFNSQSGTAAPRKSKASGLLQHAYTPTYPPLNTLTHMIKNSKRKTFYKRIYPLSSAFI